LKRLFLLLVAALALLAPAVGQAASGPAIAFTPSSNDYGTIDANTTASETFTLRNSGGKATSALKVMLTGSSAFSLTADGCNGTSLGPKKSCSVTVQYEPTAAGSTDSATLTASSKKPPASASVSLTGKSTPPNVDASLAFVKPSSQYSEPGASGEITLHNGGAVAETVSVTIGRSVTGSFAGAPSTVVSPSCAVDTVEQGGNPIQWTCNVPVLAGETVTLVALDVTGTVSLQVFASITGATFPDPDTSNNWVIDTLSRSQSEIACEDSFGGTFEPMHGNTMFACRGLLASSLDDVSAMWQVFLPDCDAFGGDQTAWVDDAIVINNIGEVVDADAEFPSTNTVILCIFVA
jgi:Cep192 domain 4